LRIPSLEQIYWIITKKYIHVQCWKEREKKRFLFGSNAGVCIFIKDTWDIKSKILETIWIVWGGKRDQEKLPNSKFL